MFVKHKKVALFLKFPPYNNIIYSVIMIFSERLLGKKKNGLGKMFHLTKL